MIGPDPFELEDIWINAFAVFPDVKPLVQLLQSETPMPFGARKTLAELLSPGDPPIDRFVLEVKLNDQFDKMIRKYNAVGDYVLQTSAGKSSDTAAEEAGAKQNVGARQVFRYLMEKIPERLHKRLRGDEDR